VRGVAKHDAQVSVLALWRGFGFEQQFWLLASKVHEVWLKGKKICRGKVRPPQFRKQLKSEAKNESSKSRKIKQ